VKAFALFLLLCTVSLANTNTVTQDIRTPVDKASEHLQNNYNLLISKQAKLTGEIIKDPSTSLIRTYTVLKIEF